MTKRKRLQNTDERSGPPRKSARLAKGTVSTEGSSKTMPRFDDDDSHDRLIQATMAAAAKRVSVVQRWFRKF